MMLVRTPPSLNIGDPAPRLTITRWVKCEPIKSFLPDKTYVVEFWASWCGPCRHAFPHLDELARSHPSVPILAISSYEDDLESARAYAESLPNSLRIGLDDQSTGRIGRTAADWMVAADEVHVPTTFLVTNGRIAWIGEPDDLDGPLHSVLSRKWDLTAAHNKRLAKLEAKAKEDGTLAIVAQINRALKDGLKRDALKLCDQIEKLPPDAKNPDMTSAAILMRCTVAYKSGDTNLFYRVLREQSASLKDPNCLNGIAWFIVDPATSLVFRDKSLGLSLALKSVELAGRSNYKAIDTLAWAQFQMGDYTGAVLTEQEAVSKCTSPKTKVDLDLTLAFFRSRLGTQHS